MVALNAIQYNYLQLKSKNDMNVVNATELCTSNGYITHLMLCTLCCSKKSINTIFRNKDFFKLCPLTFSFPGLIMNTQLLCSRGRTWLCIQHHFLSSFYMESYVHALCNHWTHVALNYHNHKLRCAVVILYMGNNIDISLTNFIYKIISTY